MNRRQAREYAFILIYEKGFQKDKPADELIKDTSAEQGFDEDLYIHNSVIGVSEKEAELDGLISEAAVGWKLERMSGVSLAIMRLATYEMLYADDVPFSVAINEAVELTKKYDHEKAPKFVNGILNRIAEIKGLKTARSE